jgi:hypothetical protein
MACHLVQRTALVEKHQCPSPPILQQLGRASESHRSLRARIIPFFMQYPLVIPVPRWMIHHAYQADQKRSVPWLRLLLDVCDLHPRQAREKLLIRLAARKLGIPRLGHIHIPKTGGTYVRAIKSSLPHVDFSHVVVRKNRSDKYCPLGLTAISPRKVRGYTLFSNVRCPARFFVSYYHHVIGFNEFTNNRHYDYCLAQKGFVPFLQTIMEREDPWPSRKFLFPQLFAEDGTCIVSCINRAETLDRDLARLCREYGLTFRPVERRRASPRADYSTYYTRPLMSSLEKTYWRENLLFGYSGLEVCHPPVELALPVREYVAYDYAEDVVLFRGRRLEPTKR